MSIPNTFVAGQPAKASEINENFTSVNSDIQTINTTLGTKADISSTQSAINSLTSQISNTNANVSALGTKVTPTINVLSSSGTIALSDNSINVINPGGAVTFTLPSVSDNTKFHQILVQIKMTTVYSIGLGTTYFFKKKTPDLSAIGDYDLIYEYDKQRTVWVVGSMKKGTAS